MNEYPKWIYPDGDVARGFIARSAEEELAPADEATQQPAIVLPVLDEPPRNKGGRPRKG